MLTHYRLKQLEEERNKNKQEQPQEPQDTEFSQELTATDNYAEMSNQAQQVSEQPVNEQVNQEVKAQQEMPKKK